MPKLPVSCGVSCETTSPCWEGWAGITTVRLLWAALRAACDGLNCRPELVYWGLEVGIGDMRHFDARLDTWAGTCARLVVAHVLSSKCRFYSRAHELPAPFSALGSQTGSRVT